MTETTGFSKKKFKEKTGMALLTSALLGLSITMVLPIIWMISASFKTENEVFAVPIRWIPKEVILSNYVSVWTDYPFINWYYNTLKVSFITIVLVLSVGSLAGYAFAKLNFRGKEFIFLMFLATMMIPVQVTLIPRFAIFKYLNMYNTHAALYLPAIFNIFSVFLFRQFFSTIPNDLAEAAKIDGCSEFRTFYQVMLPLAKSAFVALTILNFTWAYNNYMGPLIMITDIKKTLLSVGIRSFEEQYSQNYAAQMAGASCAIIPLVVLYLIAQKQFIEGIATSGIKG